MKRIGIVLAAIALLVISGQAQEPKIEIAPFAGGYFSAGFQSAEAIRFPIITVSGLTATTIGSPREFKPVDEPNSGIFGVRGSYDLTRRFTLEGTFAFSPAGRQFDLSPLLAGLRLEPDPRIVPYLDLYPIPTRFVPAFRGKDTFHYAGNVLYNWRKQNGWTIFLTGGLGAITRTAELVLRPGPFLTFVPGPFLGGSSPGSPTQPMPSQPGAIPVAISSIVPSPDETDFSVNFGGGVKKYFTNRCGIRFDFRNYTSTIGEDTVNNIEVSLGLIFRM